MNLIRFLSIFLASLCSVAGAAEIRPPSDLKVEVLGANSFLLQWKDNSNDEDGWEVFANVGANSTPASYTVLSGANRTSYTMISNEITGKLLRVQVRAYRGEGTERQYSKPTSIAEATAAETAVFKEAENLKATAIDDGRIRIRWDDPSTTEYGYFIEIRKGSGPWKFFTSTSVAARYNFVLDYLEPSTTYAFRVMGYKGQGQVTTAYSNESSAKTAAFSPPSKLKAIPEGEGLISLKWKDRSSLEEGFEIQYKQTGKKFKKLGDVVANTTSIAPQAMLLNTEYEFRLRSFRTVDKKKVFSNFSPIAKGRSSGLARPSELKIASTTETSVKLEWKDQSSREAGYTVRYKEVGKKLPKTVNVPANSATYTINDLTLGREYEFQVRAFDAKTVSRYTPAVSGTTRDNFIGSFEQSLTAGVSFLYEIGVTTPANIETTTVTGLPAGLAYDPATRTISGVVTAQGLYEAIVRAKFKAGYTISRKLVLRVIPKEGAPEIVAKLPDIQVNKGATFNVSLSGKFRDTDVTVARRFTTNLGTFDVVLFETTTPLTVQNFLAYADGDRYRNTFFHRAPTGFVVQGGGFTYNGSSFGKVATFPPVKNEPGISNLAGTVAMAKLGGDPNSATSQFFINLSDSNAPNLDSQNGGFTVFGRIPDGDMDLFEDIDALPKGSYLINPGGGAISFDDVPVRTAFPAPSTLDPSTLVRVTAVAPSPLVAFSATSLTPSVATVSMNGSTLVVTGIAKGSATIRVRATDLDGLFAEQLFKVTVP